jgi:tRNA dimethylallyltransferase
MVQSLVLTGPTAVGKTGIAIELAAQLGLEIVNADSVCFYRGFDIGSAKPSREERTRVPHHLIDVAAPDETYTAAAFLRDCLAVIEEIHARGKRALITGGSGFYLKALRFGLWDAPPASSGFRATLKDEPTESLFSRLRLEDPLHAEKVGPKDRYRLIRALEILALSGRKPSALESSMSSAPNPAFPLFVVDRDPVELAQRMETRVRAMLAAGWLEEVRALRELHPGSRTLHSVGYRQVLDFLDHKLPEGRKIRPGEAGLVDEIVLAHRQLAKQQRTWFKNMGANAEFLLDRDRDLLKEKVIGIYQ